MDYSLHPVCKAFSNDATCDCTECTAAHVAIEALLKANQAATAACAAKKAMYTEGFHLNDCSTYNDIKQSIKYTTTRCSTDQKFAAVCQNCTDALIIRYAVETAALTAVKLAYEKHGRSVNIRL